MRLQEERGSVLVIVALFLPALVLMMIFVVDVGSWWTHKRHLQLQADAAALAAGGLFNECFANNGAPLSTAEQDMQQEATKFAGVSGSLYNAQLGGSYQGSLSVLYNSKTYAAGSDPPDDTVTAPSPAPCQQPVGTPGSPGYKPGYMFDVKLSEANLPLFFNTVVPGLSVVPAINAHSRVQLSQVWSGKGNPPLAIPDTNPRHVFVTLWNMTTGATSGGGLGTYELCCYPPTPNGLLPPQNLNMWSGSVPLTLPTGNNEIGVRVGLGSVGGSCRPADGTGGTGWTCFDGTSSTTPVVAIRGYQTSGTGTPNSPILRQATETTCAGSPYFSAFNSSSFSPPQSGTCATTLSATVDWGPSCTGFTCTYTLTATDQYGSQQIKPASSGTKNYSFPYNYATGDGQEPVTLSWSYTTSGCGGKLQPPCPGGKSSGNGTFLPSTPTWKNGPLHQQAYSADPDIGASGPIRVVSVSPGTSFAEGTTQNLTFTVGLQGNLSSLPVPSPTMFLRVSSGSKNTSSVVGCDGTNTNDIVNAFVNGCQTLYQINPTGVCPDSASPPDCVPLAGGNLGATIQKALDDRFASCPPVNWPSYSPFDPRLTQLLITDEVAYLLAKGGDLVPVTNFGGFYITGWGSFSSNGKSLSCPGVNEDPPTALSKGKSNFVAIWGHFVRYIDQYDVGSSSAYCPPNNIATITPCVALLVK
jgi:hypothetical protein